MYKAVFAAFCAFYVGGGGSFQPLFFVMKSLRIFCQYSFWLTQVKECKFALSKEGTFLERFHDKFPGSVCLQEKLEEGS